MALAGEIATLYRDVQRMMEEDRSTAGSESAFQRLEEILDFMKPMVREIDKSDRDIIELLKIVQGILRGSKSTLTLRRYSNRMHYYSSMAKSMEDINKKLNKFLLDYVQLSLSKIDDEAEVEEDDPERNMRNLLIRLIGMITNEGHIAEELTKAAFKILDRTLDALCNKLDGDTDRYLPLLKKVEVLVRFHRGQYGIDIPKLLEQLERQLSKLLHKQVPERQLLPEQLLQPLDLRIEDSLGNYVTEWEKSDMEKEMKALLVVIIFIASVMFSYIKKWKDQEWNGFIIFIVLNLIIFVMPYIWYRHQWTTRKTLERFNHVFLSCRGDILETHANPLYMALTNIQLRTFYYVKREDLGRRIKEKLQEGVKHSASAIIIFSKEFATSNWCLYELVLILERNKTSFYPIIPIYCDGVNYTDLTFEKGISIYKEALKNHKIIYGKEKVKVWKKALQDVGGRVARSATGSESEITRILEKVAKDIKEEITPFVRVP